MFLAENGQAWIRRSKARPKRSQPVHFSEKGLKNNSKRDGRSVFGPHRRKRIVFLRNFGDARLGRLKKGLGRDKKAQWHEKGAKLGEAKTCLDRTGVSGSPFSRSSANHRNPAQNHIGSEGQAYVKD